MAEMQWPMQSPCDHFRAEGGSAYQSHASDRLSVMYTLRVPLLASMCQAADCEPRAAVR